MKLTVLQWNIEYGEDVAAVGNFLRQVSADIICLQELTRGYHKTYPDAGAYLARALGYDGYYQYGLMRFPNGQQGQMGVGLFSRFSLSNPQKIVLQESLSENGLIKADERLCLQATVTVGTTKIVINTTHLAFHPRFTTIPRKQAMVESILQSQPFELKNRILAADLNTTPRTKAAKTLRSELRNAGPALHYPTWTTKPFHIGPWSYDELKWRLDYILYSGAIRSVYSKILQPSLSDHLPILVEFEV